MPYLTLTDLKEIEPVTGFKGRFAHSDHVTMAYWNIASGAPRRDALFYLISPVSPISGKPPHHKRPRRVSNQTTMLPQGALTWRCAHDIIQVS